MLKERTLNTTLVSNTIGTEDRRYSEEAQRFHAWLVAHVTRKPDIQTEQAYKQESAAQLYRGKYIQQFAPFRAAQSAYQTWTPGQVVLLSVLAAITMVSIILTGISTLTAIFSIVTLFYVALLGLSVAWLIGVSRPAPSTPFSLQTIDELKHAPWPSYTILCPLYREKAIVPQFVEAMRALDYPADCLQVLFLTEQDDDETRWAILSMNLPDHFEVLTVPPGTPRTKPRACNYGLLHATGEYVVIFDAEDVPDPLQLKKAVLTFASVPPEVACVQAKLNFYNPAQNVLTRWFTVEYSLWFDLILPGLQRIGFSLPLGGTSNHFRASILRALGAWDAFNVTEDCDLGLKLAEQGLQTVVMDSTTYEEANSRPFSWIKQRSRWIKGYMQTYLIHTRHPLKSLKKGKIKGALSLHLFVGTGSMILLVNPVMWAMFAAYLIWRPVALYHQLFPWPVLYAGMLCFLVGNFLPIYASMVACVKREHYALVKWCLLLPLYWILASVAAFMAGYELFTAPHRWHKTQHGLHLMSRGDTSKVAAVKTQTTHVGSARSSVVAMAGVTASVRAMPTVLTPAVRSVKAKGSKARDPWLWLTLFMACGCSIGALIYFYLHHDILDYSDSYSHMHIARSMIDSITPGFGQLGGVWLPLPHLLMLPFIWNDFLWTSGLAGALPSSICYVGASVYLYLTIKKLTRKGYASFIGTAIFMLNPNVLYLQSTPLTEAASFITFLAAFYYLLTWLEKSKASSLLAVAFSIFLATLTRYDGWILYPSIILFIAVIGMQRKWNFAKLQANIILFGVLGGLGIVLWLVWNKLIFNNFLYFQRGPYSSETQTLYNFKNLTTYHNLWESIRYYAFAIYDTVGLPVILFAVAGLLLFVIFQKNRDHVIGMIACLSPIAFYVLSFYTGQVNIFVPGVSSALFNSRYGSEIVAPSAIFIGILVSMLLKYIDRSAVKFLLQFIIGVLVFCHPFLIASMGVVTLQEGRHGFPCVSTQPMNIYLAQHYDGGKILEDYYLGSLNEGQELDIHLDQIIYQGSGDTWRKSLIHPELYANWIIVGERPANSPVPYYVNVQAASFAQNYILVYQSNGFDLYHLRSKSIPRNAIDPSSLQDKHPYCGH